MRRPVSALVALFVGALAYGGSGEASARDEPHTAQAVRRAADAFDEASRAYRAGNYSEAASHFEAADAAVPSAKALRMAMRSRLKAAHRARAATLAAQVEGRYPDDARTLQLAREMMDQLRAELQELVVSCAVPCVLAIDQRTVSGPPRTQTTLFLEPGEARLSASFTSEGAAVSELIVAVAGQTGSVSFEPPPPKPDVESTEPKPVGTLGEGVAGREEAAAGPAQEPVVGEVVETGKQQGALSSTEGRSWFRSPALFYGELAVTAALGGVTIWSGVDTLEHPGKEAVRTSCVGQGTSCAVYQDGLARQQRTNVLIGVSAGLGVLTAITGIALTDWASTDPRLDAVVLSPHGATLLGRF